MIKEVRRYIADVERLLSGGTSGTDWQAVRGEMLTRIGFYQHERLIHLIVTALFAVMAVLCFAASFFAWQCGVAAAALLCLEVPYIFHYFFLENSVQKLYRLYDDVLGRGQ